MTLVCYVSVVSFLPPRDEFHHIHNQSREMLANLSNSRFKDLSSDVHYEVCRRVPEFKAKKGVAVFFFFFTSIS
jgi:protein SPA2